MSEEEGSRKVRKTGSPKVRKKSEAGSLKSEVGMPNAEVKLKAERLKPKAKENSAFDTPHSALNKSEIENPTSEIKEMEVHHHPEVEKKGFKEYILEGLMIFVAVTMGFFAESLREHINEGKRAREYAVTLVRDLKEDTVTLHKYVKRANYASANVDTLMKMLTANDPRNIPSGKLYWYGLFGGAQLAFSPHDATLLEMKNSGSLRYFSNPKLNRQVAEYDQLLQLFRELEAQEQGIYTEVRKARAQLFDFKYNDAANTVVQRIYVKYNQASIDSFIHTNPPLLSYDKVVFNEYIEMVRSRFMKNSCNRADTLKHHATLLIGALKKEYSLEDE
jgi:hypothetical protein